MRGLKVHAQRAGVAFGPRIECWITSHDLSYVAQAPLMVKQDDSIAGFVQPTFTLSMEDGQQLIDQLWNCGLRPTDGSGSAGALAAVQTHLRDMQRIVFKDFPQERKP